MKNKFNSDLSGAHILDKNKISEGYIFYEGKIINLNGKIIHKWKNTYLGLILPNGHYLAQKEYEAKKWGLYTWDDKIVWEKNFAIHHDIIFTPNDTIITFTKEMHTYKGRKVDFDIIIEYNLDGEELQRWSTWENLDKLKILHPPLELERPKVFFLPEKAKRKDTTPWGGNYDYYRLNSLQIIPRNSLGKKDKRFQEGNWLISFRHGSIILILDKNTREIVYSLTQKDIEDEIQGQHSPQILQNGNILIFDNGRYRKWSRIIELNPLTKEITWQYNSNPKKDFFTLSEGYVQPLPNGNYLITESEKGKIFEITKEKEIVWEYYHPDKQDKNNSPLHPESWGERQWIYRAIKYPEEFIKKFLK